MSHTTPSQPPSPRDRARAAPGAAPPPVSPAVLDALDAALSPPPEPAAESPAWLRARPAPAPRRPRARVRRVLQGFVLAGSVALLLLLTAGWWVTRHGAGVLPPRPTATPHVEATAPPAAAFFPAGGRATPGLTPTADRPDQPDPPLPAALAAAARAEAEGRYADAISLYGAAVAAGGPPPTVQAARWRLAISLFDNGDYDAAIEAFHTFADAYPADPRSLRAAFWAGRAHLAAGRPRAALAEWLSYAPVAGPLRPTTLNLAADAAVAMGDPDQARTLLTSALGGSTTRLDRLGSWARLASVESDAGAPARAAPWYDAIAQAAHDPAYRAQMLLAAGNAYLQADEPMLGEQRLTALVHDLPDQPAAYQGLQKLLATDAGVVGSDRLPYDLACRAAYSAGHYDEALADCAALRDAEPPGATRATAAWYTALSYQALDNATLADSWLKAFTEVYTTDARLPDALLRWGNAAASAGDAPAALAHYQQLGAQFPNSPAAAAGADQAGLVLRRQGDLAGAAAQWATAALAPGADDSLRARAWFWQGWCLQQQGQADAAAAAWRKGAAYPTFWGQRSQDHLTAAGLVPRDDAAARAAGQAAVAAARTPDPAARAADDAALLRWAAGWSAAAPTPVPARAADALPADPDTARTLALAHVELWDLTTQAFDDLGTTLEGQRDGAALAALALTARDAGWPWLADSLTHHLRAAATAAGQAPGVAGLPRAAQEMVYPLAWPALVGPVAGDQSVDPLLLLALMRQESAYDPRAQSWSDARGLTQVIPGTAAGIASALGIPDFAPSLLYRPAVGVQFGAYYLNQTLDRFDRNILYALAGYNGGPANVPNWAGGAVHDDPDLFVDNIPYGETQTYVEIVYANYAVYRQLYAGR